MEVAEDELHDLYTWVDAIPLSRPKRNIARDFSDGVLVAEVVHHFFPRDVQLHNYSPANAFAQKMYNWSTLNAKVLHKLGISIPKPLCEAAARAAPMAVEKILKFLRYKFSELMDAHEQQQAEEAALLPEFHDSAPTGKTASGRLVAASSHQRRENSKASDLDTINELREINEILETKTRKLEQLVRLKDAKIQALKCQLEGAGVS